MSGHLAANSVRSLGIRWWLWAALGAALLWSGLVRVPLIVHAESHLDSDLAVDGLTLIDSIQGRWRWHYPGTPHIASLPVLLSLPQSLALGATPATLVSGGVVAYLLLVLASFDLARQLGGTRVAIGTLVPLAFASNGMIWLSGRITGGHLVAAFWHAGAFGILARLLDAPSPRKALALGLWCGFGLYLDSMFLASILGVGVGLGVGLTTLRTKTGVIQSALLVFVGIGVGLAPRVVGGRVDPYSAYENQFQLVRDPQLIGEHASLLVQECLPRLFWGHTFPDLRTDPDPRSLGGGTAHYSRPPDGVPPLFVAVTCLGVLVTATSAGAFLAVLVMTPNPVVRSVLLGLTASSAVVLAGFVLNRNIFNSDNYRYLVCLVVPWSLGWGLFLDTCWRKGTGGVAVAILISTLWIAALTLDTAGWYARFGWVDERGWPRAAQNLDPLTKWFEVRPEVNWVEGGYWDVYRIAFLSGGRVRGAPYPIYPNRFPDWRPPQQGRRVLIARPTPEGRVFADRALEAGGRVDSRVAGATLIVQP